MRILRTGAIGMFLLAVLAAPGFAGTVYADRNTFDAQFPTADRENWDSITAGTTIANGATVNGITYNSSVGISVVTSSFLVTTGANGLGRTPIEFFGIGDAITFTFGTQMNSFGLDINTFSTADGSYTATTNTGEVFSSSFDPFPGFTTGQFVGFTADNAFSSVTITTATGGQVYTVDSMRFVAVPLPGAGIAGLCLLAGLGTTVGLRRKLRRRK